MHFGIGQSIFRASLRKCRAVFLSHKFSWILEKVFVEITSVSGVFSVFMDEMAFGY